jgi:inorganic pyrophosphatase
MSSSVLLASAFLILSLVQSSPRTAPPAAAASERCPAPAAAGTPLRDQAREKLARSLAAARAHGQHLWRDTKPVNQDRTVNVFVEIAPGSREKYEFDMGANRRELNRVVPEKIGGYPIAYGFVPGTVGLDGDPFDGLVLGDDVPAGALVRGHVVGIMHMTDEKGSDSKVVVSAESDAATRRALFERAKPGVAAFFNRYKADDDDAESHACVSGWGGVEEARRYVDAAVRAFQEGTR